MALFPRPRLAFEGPPSVVIHHGDQQAALARDFGIEIVKDTISADGTRRVLTLRGRRSDVQAFTAASKAEYLRRGGTPA